MVLHGFLTFIMVSKYTYFSIFLANLVISILERGAINECGNKLLGCIISVTVIYFIYWIRTSIDEIYYKKIAANVLSPPAESNVSPLAESQPTSRPMVPWYINNPCITLVELLGFLGINIWACVAYFNLDSECYNFYTNNHIHLLNMLLANVIIFFIYAGIFVFALIVLCCLIKYDHSHSENRSVVQILTCQYLARNEPLIDVTNTVASMA